MIEAHPSFSQYLPYEAYADHLFFNRSTMGFGFLSFPIVGFDQGSHTQMTGIFQHLLPEGSSIQYLLFADPYVGDILDAFKKHVGASSIKDPSIMQKLVGYRTRYFKQNASKGKLRQFRLYLSVTLPLSKDLESQRRKVSDLRVQVEATLKQLGLPINPLTPHDLIDLYDKILVTDLEENDYKSAPIVYDPYLPIRDSMPTKNRKLTVGQKGIIVSDGEKLFRGYSVSKFPSHWTQFMMGDLIGDPHSDLRQLETPFFIHYAVHIPKQTDLVMNTSAKASHLERQVGSPIAKFLPKMREELGEYQYLARQLSSGHRFVRTTMTVGLISDPHQMDIHEAQFMNLYRTAGFEMKREDYLHAQTFLTSLPMSFGDEMLKELKGCQKLKTTISSESANLLPLQGEWCGSQTKALLLSGRRGQIVTFSPFDNQAGNYNVSVVGRSGSGKSVFMQEMMTSTLRLNGKVFVLDVGRSFQKTCLLLKGQFVEFTLKKPLCVNPFPALSQLDDIEAEERLSTLKPVLLSMVAPNETISDLEVSLLDEAMRTVFFKERDQTTFSKIADYLNAQKDLRAQDLGKRLFAYTKDGQYGRFFEGSDVVNFNDSFVVIEFEELKEKKDLQSVILQMVIVNITNSMFLGNRQTPFMICFDEAWDMLRGKQAGVFIETLARRLRKYFGSLVVGTQSVNDFYATPGALAAFENSDYLCMLSQKPESINILKEKKRVTMTDHMEKELRSVHTKAGAYAEIMIVGPHGYATTRLILDPFSQTLYSTTPAIYTAVETLVNQGVPMGDAIECVAGLKTYAPQQQEKNILLKGVA
ncbi:MAG: type IV secretion system protein TraC [Alphaproteobacteria bacterium]|nr:type IV secretion system protein TraC [Alphaproteobacteria bacterium]